MDKDGAGDAEERRNRKTEDDMGLKLENRRGFQPRKFEVVSDFGFLKSLHGKQIQQQQQNPHQQEPPAKRPLPLPPPKRPATKLLIPLEPAPPPLQEMPVPTIPMVEVPPEIPPVEVPKMAAISAPPKMPPEPKMPLTEFCMSLPLNFHQSTVETLIRHIDALNADAEYEVKILLVTGHCGIGKTFCVRRACEQAGYDLVDVDLLGAASFESRIASGYQQNQDAKIRGALTSPPDVFGKHSDKQIRVLLLEAIDGMEKEQLTRISKILRSVLFSSDPRAAVKFKPNMVVLTANDRYDKQIDAFMRNLFVTEVKVNELDSSQTTTLVRHACEYTGTPMDERVYRLIQSSMDNTGALLMKVQFVPLSTDHNAQSLEESMKLDDRGIDIFKCCYSVLQPKPTYDPETQQYIDVSFEEYERKLDLGGDHEPKKLGGSKVHNTLFNSYMRFVPYVPETPASVSAFAALAAPRGPVPENVRRDAETTFGTGNYAHKGLDTMAALADEFSLLDAIPFHADEFMTTAVKMNFRFQLKDVIARNSKDPQIDVKSRMPSTEAPKCLRQCGVWPAVADKLRCVQTIHRIISERQINDFTYKPDESVAQYELSKHVGMFWILVDTATGAYGMTDICTNGVVKAKKTLTKASSSRKAKAASRDNDADPHSDPRLECIKLFSHRFTVSDPTNPDQPGGTTAVRLSDGRLVKRRKR